MTLSDPRPALGQDSSFIGYLVGIVSMAGSVRSLAAYREPVDTHRPADDFVHLLLGVCALGAAIEDLT
ncbi:hypothetical protein FK535_09650 [Mycolicibacterium sp. 018/SC-01/001]|uniref:hypothetical protein n=1 Tax=Mycolicibacterium sp. 018/SC-01/001 TaxID=2592069 RepID=UPI001180B35F|nr:hypothetical protein [Mycolicibacterium sp. 018/SC-01/001]TRW84748.1 hypothetical protein FK535_09650 [Mycolicibacterium sp. 018/SC-01/001]